MALTGRFADSETEARFRLEERRARLPAVRIYAAVAAAAVLATWMRVRDRAEFDPPETMVLKGVGEMAVYRLRRPLPHRPSSLP